jgi:hypothetical protein
LIVGFALGMFFGYLAWGLPPEVQANKKIWICHKPGKLDQNKKINESAWPGHRGHGDHKGKCRPQPTATATPRPTKPPKPTPTPSESPKPTPTVLVCLDNGVDEPRELTIPRTQEAWDRVLFSWPESYVGECKVEPTPEPTVEPTPDPTPESTPGPTSEPLVHHTTGTPETCAGVPTPTEPANFHLYRNGELADLRWSPTEGDTVNIYWKNPSAGDWEHSLINTPNDGNEIVGNLGSYDWTFGLAQVNGNCNESDIVEVVDGMTSEWILFR